MADEPDNLTLRMLREMRDEIREIRTDLAAQSKKIEESNQNVVYALGFAMTANLRSERVETSVEDVMRRLKRVEEKA